jgi:hypothetical protein
MRAILMNALWLVIVTGCSEQNMEKGSAGAGGSGTAGGGFAGAAGSSASSGMGGGSLDNTGGGASNVAGSEGGGDSGIGGSGAGNRGDERAPDSTAFTWRTLPSLAKKRQNAMGAAVGETMYVIGGLDESGLLAEVERLDPGQTGWTAASPLPSPQCCAAAGVLGAVIAVAGGYGPDGFATDALLLVDTMTGTWQSGPPMPTARANAMAAVWNGKLAVSAAAHARPRKPRARSRCMTRH